MAATEITETVSLDSSGYAISYDNINAVTTLPDAKVVRLVPGTPTQAYAHFQDLYYQDSDFDTFVMEITEGLEYRLVVRPDDLTDFDLVIFESYIPTYADADISAPVNGAFYSGVGTATYSGDFYVSLCIAAVTVLRDPPTTPYTIELLVVGGEPVSPFTEGSDTVTLSSPGEYSALGGNDIVTGSDGDDTIFGNEGNDRLSGKDGADRLSGGNGRDTLLGGVGADTLLGGSGHDKLYGGNGNDRLEGGRGNDALKGRAGKDVFIFKENFGTDRITDFKDDVDTVRLDDALWKGSLSKAEIIDRFAEVKHGNVVFEFPDEKLVIKNFTDLSELRDDLQIV